MHDAPNYVTGMNLLRSALDVIAATLEMPQTLAETLEGLERGLERSLVARRVEIRHGEVAERRAQPREIRLPLLLDGAAIGTMSLSFDAEPGEGERDVAHSLAAPLAAVLAWRAHSDDRSRLNALARTDGLTNLANRMAFDERLASMWNRGATRSAPVTVALLDVDYFKVYNDMYGHVAGDDCLRAVAATLAERTKAGFEFVARYGGEEFALISETLEPDAAVAAIGELFRRLEEQQIVHEGSTLGRVSISAGIASVIPSENRAAGDLVREADRSLYRAKLLGRNRVCSGARASNGAVASRHARAPAGPPPLEDATVGRDADLTHVTAALRQTRMITLVGPEGIGKSRLARLAGSAVQNLFTDGAVYVDFSLLTAESDPAAALGSALDATVESGDLVEALADALRERTVLVILDGVDAVDHARLVHLCERLLEALPSIAIVATSRRALGFRAERVVVVPVLGEEAAVELLRVRSGSSSGRDGATLRKIAAYLGGYPAAIEAAARNLALSSPRETLECLSTVVEVPVPLGRLDAIFGLGSPLRA
jgi:diguanylate cyclase (GGDEF)-like protein